MNRDIQDRTQTSRLDPRSTEELISIALTEEDAWEPVTVLQFRANREVLDAAQRLCNSENPKERALGADILGQLGVPDRAFPDESLETLLTLLHRETHPDVLNSVGIALGYLHDTRAIGPLISLKDHLHEDVRYGVVVGLLKYDDEGAIAALIELSRDEDAHVRDWAIFGLGSQIETDTEQIRDALFARITDPHDDTRGEALVGLARRKDERVIAPLIEEFSSGRVGYLSLEAAAEIQDKRLCPALLKLREWWLEDDDRHTRLLEEAIEESMCEIAEPDTKTANEGD